MQLNHEKLHERLLVGNKACALAEYIFEKNGTEARRLDYRSAAKALGIAKNTVGATLLKLVLLNVVTVDDGTVQINVDLIKED